MEFKNHKIIEAVCAFRFNPSENNWDITSFADYYNAIKEMGFSKKQEIKPMQLSFQLKMNEPPPIPQMVEGETQIVFKNEKEDQAILLGNNYISFHTINHYPGWEIFSDNLIAIYLQKYFDIGYGKGLLSAQMIYINKFDVDKTKKLSDYLSFVPAMERFGEGDELSHLFQSAYKIAPNKNLQLKTILNVVNPDKTKTVILECNCIANNTSDRKISWMDLSRDAHDSAKNAFINIATQYFKDQIA
jgi:uncharacterized protein (TIGR04255 family)